MTIHPTGRYTKKLGINMKIDMAKEQERRANSIQLSTGAYYRIIFANGYFRSRRK